jgi:hypothetical protein
VTGSLKLATLLVLSSVMGCGYAPVAAFIARNIEQFARAVGGAL